LQNIYSIAPIGFGRMLKTADDLKNTLALKPTYDQIKHAETLAYVIHSSLHLLLAFRNPTWPDYSQTIDQLMRTFSSFLDRDWRACPIKFSLHLEKWCNALLELSATDRDCVPKDLVEKLRAIVEDQQLTPRDLIQLEEQLGRFDIPSDTTRDVQDDHQQYSMADAYAWNEAGDDVQVFVNGKFNGPLPVGWEMRVVGGQLAFFDRKSGETTTVDPRYRRAVLALGELPDGYELTFTSGDTPRPYYKHKGRGELWLRPH
jgi:hypothetical protein